MATDGLTRFLRGRLRAAGYDLVRYPPRGAAKRSATKKAATKAVTPPAPATNPGAERDHWHHVTRVLAAEDVDLLIDVGANQGQFARAMRAHGYAGRIVSFEPVAAAYEVAARHAGTDPLWEVHRLALGSVAGSVTINVAANAAQSSSVLPMLERHERGAPHATYVGTEEVTVMRLDDAPVDLGRAEAATRAFLKIDTQGFESEVLAGAPTLLTSVVRGLQLELSLVPLYDGGPLYLDLIEQAAGAGFRLTHVIPGFSDRVTGEMLQFDGIFVRDETT